MAIGTQSKSARTYLEKHLDEFDCDHKPLCPHGLLALRDTLPNEADLCSKVSIPQSDFYSMKNESLNHECLAKWRCFFKFFIFE